MTTKRIIRLDLNKIFKINDIKYNKKCQKKGKISSECMSKRMNVRTMKGKRKQGRVYRKRNTNKKSYKIKYLKYKHKSSESDAAKALQELNKKYRTPSMTPILSPKYNEILKDSRLSVNTTLIKLLDDKTKLENKITQDKKLYQDTMNERLKYTPSTQKYLDFTLLSTDILKRIQKNQNALTDKDLEIRLILLNM